MQVAYQMARHLAQAGHEVIVAASDYTPDGSRFPKGDFQVYLFTCLFSRWGFYVSPSMIPWLYKNLRGFDIIHLHNVRTFQNIVVSLLAKYQGVPYVLSAHGSLPILDERKGGKQAFDLLFGRRLIRDAAQLVAVSPAEARQFVQAGMIDERISTVYNGLDRAEFTNLPVKGKLRSRLHIPDEAELILFLGRIHRIKGLDHLIAAFVKLLKQRPDVYLVCAGPDDGDLVRLQEMVHQSGVAEHIHFPGGLYGEEKLSGLVDADLVVLPSRYEIFGLAPFEAILCGTPVVVSADSAAGELIGNANAGYLTPYGNIAQLTATLADALNDKEQSARLVQSGQAFVRQQLQWPALIQQLEAVYQGQIASVNPSQRMVKS